MKGVNETVIGVGRIAIKNGISHLASQPPSIPNVLLTSCIDGGGVDSMSHEMRWDIKWGEIKGALGFTWNGVVQQTGTDDVRNASAGHLW